MNAKVFAVIMAILAIVGLFGSWLSGAGRLSQMFWVLDADIWAATWCVMHHLDRKATDD